MVAGFLLGGAALFVALVQLGAVLVYGLIRLVFLLIALGIEHARERRARQAAEQQDTDDYPRVPAPFLRDIALLRGQRHRRVAVERLHPPHRGRRRLFGPRRRGWW